MKVMSSVSMKRGRGCFSDDTETQEEKSTEQRENEGRVFQQKHKALERKRIQEISQEVSQEERILTRTTEDPNQDKKGRNIFPVEENIYLCHSLFYPSFFSVYLRDSSFLRFLSRQSSD